MEKGRLGEEAFKEALIDYPVFMNIAYGKRQNDIDHLVLTGNSVIMNECKNINQDFFMWYSWFSSHVVDRYADGLPIAQYYARTFGYPIQRITFTLTIPYLRTEPIVRKAIGGLKIHLIETGKQLLKDEDKKRWYSPVRRQILSVINTRRLNYSPFIYSINSVSDQNNHVSSNSNDDTDENHGESSDEEKDNMASAALINFDLDEGERKVSEAETPQIMIEEKKYAEVTLRDFMPTVSNSRNLRTKKKKEKIESWNQKCKDKALVFCNHRNKPFYACFGKIYDLVYDQIKKSYCREYPSGCQKCEQEELELCVANECYFDGCQYEIFVEDDLSIIIDGCNLEEARDLYGITDMKFKYVPPLIRKDKNRYCVICRCRAIRIIDEEIIERVPIREIAKYEPCKIRCIELRNKYDCSYEKEKPSKEERKQRKLSKYLRRARTNRPTLSPSEHKLEVQNRL